MCWGDIFTPERANYYFYNPVEYAHDVIFNESSERRGGTQTISGQQEDLWMSVVENRRTTVASGRGTGKTAWAAMLAQWWPVCHPDQSKVIITAPSIKTLNSSLWPEIPIWLDTSYAKPLFDYKAERMKLKENPDRCFCEKRTAVSKESFSGIHAPNLLIIADEASGITDEILEYLDDTLTQKNNKLVLLSNPTKTTGVFYNTHKSPVLSKLWSRKKLSALDSPFTDKEVLEVKRQQYGEHHPLYRVNILGEFPDGNSDAYIELSKVEDAMQRVVEPEGKEVEIGVDVARFGDDKTVMCWRDGYKVYPFKKYSKIPTTETTRKVIELVKEARDIAGFYGRIKVKIDCTGVGGGVYDQLNEDTENNIEVIECNFGGAGDDKFHNETSIMWGSVKSVIDFIELPEDQDLKEELASRRWNVSVKGKTEIESKKIYKKEFGKSPDCADALCLLFAKKQNTRAVIKNFNPLDKEIIRDNISYAGDLKYGSVYYTKDLIASVLYISWDGYRLYCYDECVSTDTVIDVAINLKNHSVDKIFGNKDMFSTGGDDLAYKFRQYGISIYENFRFDELSSIELLSNLVYQKRVIISSRCLNLIRQLTEWRLEKNKVSKESKYGLCLALCDIISELRSSIEKRNSGLSFHTSSYKPPQPKDRNVRTSWMSNR